MPSIPVIKSPVFLTGFGFLGSGAVGIGGGQIYEETYPTMHKTMSRKGFEGNPIVSPNEIKVEGVRVSGSTGGCAKRLFSGVDFKHDVKGSSVEKLSYTEELGSLSNETKPIGCAIMELHPVKDEDKNYFYFRSELVIKGENVGWVFWTGMASGMENQQGSTTKEFAAYFLHKLIFLKKEESEWKVKEGYLGAGYLNSSNLSNEKVFIKSPRGGGFEGRTMGETSSFSERKWSGIGEVGGNPGNSILKDVEAYINSPADAEVLGADGNFSSSTAGYKYMSELYKEDEGWL